MPVFAVNAASTFLKAVSSLPPHRDRTFSVPPAAAVPGAELPPAALPGADVCVVDVAGAVVEPPCVAPLVAAALVAAALVAAAAEEAVDGLAVPPPLPHAASEVLRATVATRSDQVRVPLGWSRFTISSSVRRAFV